MFKDKLEQTIWKGFFKSVFYMSLYLIEFLYIIKKYSKTYFLMAAKQSIIISKKNYSIKSSKSQDNIPPSIILDIW